MPISNAHDSFALRNTVHNQVYDVVTDKQKEYQNQVVFSHHGLTNHVLEGHGPHQDYFERREFGSSYDLSYNQKIKPQTQIYSKFQPNHDVTQKAFHKDAVYEKAHQTRIPEMGDKALLKEPKKYIHYHEFTKGFDQT